MCNDSVLYTRWRPSQYRIGSLGAGHRLGCGQLAQGQHP